MRHERRRGEGKDRIELTMSVGGELTAEQIARLRDVSHRCPVHRMLLEGVKISEA